MRRFVFVRVRLHGGARLLNATSPQAPASMARVLTFVTLGLGLVALVFAIVATAVRAPAQPQFTVVDLARLSSQISSGPRNVH